MCTGKGEELVGFVCQVPEVITLVGGGKPCSEVVEVKQLLGEVWAAATIPQADISVDRGATLAATSLVRERLVPVWRVRQCGWRR